MVRMGMLPLIPLFTQK
ncbi:hypothetical protein KIPB_016542, partial [Kipferlia bialata]|eukprot:g16542.t1